MRITKIEAPYKPGYTQDSTYKQKSQRDNTFKQEIVKAARKNNEKQNQKQNKSEIRISKKDCIIKSGEREI